MMFRRRTILKSLLAAIGAIGASVIAIPAFRSMGLSADKSPRYMDIDAQNLSPGEVLEFDIYGNQVLILRRTPEMLLWLEKPDKDLKDPASEMSIQPGSVKNTLRSIQKEYFVAFSRCTHLGCIVKNLTPEEAVNLEHGERGVFYCPCHSSTFDLAGRVYKGFPAPTNLEVPEYEILENGKFRIYARI